MRLAILTVVLIYLCGVGTVAGFHDPDLRTVLLYVLIESLVGTGILIGIARQPGRFARPPRRSACSPTTR